MYVMSGGEAACLILGQAGEGGRRLSIMARGRWRRRAAKTMARRGPMITRFRRRRSVIFKQQALPAVGVHYEGATYRRRRRGRRIDEVGAAPAACGGNSGAVAR